MKEKMQEVFDTVREHLLKQNARSKKDWLCVYLSPGGMKCAVGCLIKPEHYNPAMENIGLISKGSQRLRMALCASLGFEPDDTMYQMLSKMQVIHDTVLVAAWPDELQKMAESFGLVY
jgi:carbohydrate-binding DOMON domain-containing protein